MYSTKIRKKNKDNGLWEWLDEVNMALEGEPRPTYMNTGRYRCAHNCSLFLTDFAPTRMPTCTFS